MARAWSRVVRFVPPVVAGWLPALLLGIGSAIYILNHFFVNAPYLLDSGFYSALIYHAGISPQNPNIALNFAPDYFTFHFSPYVVVFSLLSYIQPLQRIEYYALFQGIVYAPLGAVTYAVSRHLEPDRMLRRILITLAAALAFSFSGLVLTFIGYPHYEPAMCAFICFALLFVITGRVRLAWLFIVLAAMVREDGGFHTGLALMPLLYLRWRGVSMPVTVRQLITMIGGACAMSIAGVAFQKIFFATTTLNHIYLGSPPFHHVTSELLATRADNFIIWCKHIYYPFLATCLIAILRRDARYLLGWVATVPWFLLNILALQDVKATFFGYTAIPFVVSIFWVYLYGAMIAPKERRLRAGLIELLFALVSLSSTLGIYRVDPGSTKFILKQMAVRGKWRRADVHAYAEGIGKRKANFGKKMYVDYAAASLALEWLRSENSWNPKVADADAIAFHRELYVHDPSMLNSFVKNKLDVCTRISSTPWMVCSHEPPPPGTFVGVETMTFPSVFAFSRLWYKGVSVEPSGIVLRENGDFPGRIDAIAPGAYELAVDVESTDVSQTKLEVRVGEEPTPVVQAASGAHELVVRFTVDKERQYVRFVLSHTSSPLTITAARLRRVDEQMSSR